MIVLTIHDRIESFDRIFDIYKNTFKSSECFSNVERLRKETLYATCTVNHLLIFIRQFIHTKDGDDIL